MGIEETIASLRKMVPHAFEYDDRIESISTGSIAVDMITGIGGFPRGRLSEVFGWEGSGKTILSLTACAAAQRSGLYPAYIDAERGVDLFMAEKIGFDYADPKRGLYLTPSTFEETVKVTKELVESGQCHLIVVDSVPAMVPQSELDGEIEEIGQIGVRARLLSATLPRLTKLIDANKVALVMINQMRKLVPTGFGAQYGPKESSSGGSALKFYSSLRINMKLVKQGAITRKKVDPFTGKEVEVAVANVHSATAFKNKVSAPYRDAAFTLRYDEVTGIYGIDNLQTILDMAVAKGVIVRKGAFYQYSGAEDNVNAQGADRLYQYMLEHPDTVTEIQGRLAL